MNSLHTGAVSGPSHGWVELLSWKPRAFLYHNFLSEAEADHIVSAAKPWVSCGAVCLHLSIAPHRCRLPSCMCYSSSSMEPIGVTSALTLAADEAVNSGGLQG